MKKIVIKRIDAKCLAKLMAYVGILFGLIAGVFGLLGSIFGGNIIAGIIMAILLPLLYAGLMYIAGYLNALVMNFALTRINGLILEAEIQE